MSERNLFCYHWSANGELLGRFCSLVHVHKFLFYGLEEDFLGGSIPLIGRERQRVVRLEGFPSSPLENEAELICLISFLISCREQIRDGTVPVKSFSKKKN